MIRHDQYLQDVEAIASLYQSLGEAHHTHAAKSEQWNAIFSVGPMEQLEEIKAEMHEYLSLAFPAPSTLVSPLDDLKTRMAGRTDFNVALERLVRLYRALGEVRKELAQFYPDLYVRLGEQLLPALRAVQAALHTYLKWDNLNSTLAQMEGQIATEPNGAHQSSPPTSPTQQPLAHKSE